MNDQRLKSKTYNSFYWKYLLFSILGIRLEDIWNGKMQPGFSVRGRFFLQKWARLKIRNSFGKKRNFTNHQWSQLLLFKVLTTIEDYSGQISDHLVEKWLHWAFSFSALSQSSIPCKSRFKRGRNPKSLWVWLPEALRIMQIMRIYLSTLGSFPIKNEICETRIRD